MLSFFPLAKDDKFWGKNHVETQSCHIMSSPSTIRTLPAKASQTFEWCRLGSQKLKIDHGKADQSCRRLDTEPAMSLCHSLSFFVILCPLLISWGQTHWTGGRLSKCKSLEVSRCLCLSLFESSMSETVRMILKAFPKSR